VSGISRFQRLGTSADGYLGRWPRLLHLRAFGAYVSVFIKRFGSALLIVGV